MKSMYKKSVNILFAIILVMIVTVVRPANTAHGGEATAPAPAPTVASEPTPHPTPTTDPAGVYLYQITNNAITINRYIGPETDIIIHAEIDGLPVTRIGDRAFADRGDIESIFIPDSVTVISGSAFEGCASLVSIRLPEALTSIRERTFKGCVSLADVTIGHGV